VRIKGVGIRVASVDELEHEGCPGLRIIDYDAAQADLPAGSMLGRVVVPVVEIAERN
jgi:hypothetical protein